MENLIPPVLRGLREVKWRLNSGISMNESVHGYLNEVQDDFSARVRRLWILKSQGLNTAYAAEELPTHFQRAFWQLIERGSRGEPCLEALNSLEGEVEQAAQAELDEHLAILPFKVLLPLLFLQFPAYLILLLGPLLRSLRHELGG